jgi:hypothetical protein
VQERKRQKEVAAQEAAQKAEQERLARIQGVPAWKRAALDRQQARIEVRATMSSKAAKRLSLCGLAQEQRNADPAVIAAKERQALEAKIKQMLPWQQKLALKKAGITLTDDTPPPPGISTTTPFHLIALS